MTINQEKIRILILDDEKNFTEELREFLENSDMTAIEAHTTENGLHILRTTNIDLLILDVRLGNTNGLDFLKQIKDTYPELEVIVVSGHGDMETVIKALRLGAHDYLQKPFRHKDMTLAIERTRKYAWLQKHIHRLHKNRSLIPDSLEKRIDRPFIGISPLLTEVIEAANTAAAYPDVNVLITGESGTGKDNIARIIHYSSRRKDHSFCAVNSCSFSDSLIESEFFGHKKGSFTGAVDDKIGYFEACNKGTLFLDEIGDMPLSLQTKILRAIEEKKICRVGETKQISTDFRIVSATNQHLAEKIEKKEFRLDLYQRLNTLHIHIPPLRERPEDIKPLLDYFLCQFAQRYNKPNMQFDERILNALMDYSFPGNVRELRNMTERAIILAKGNTLALSAFPIKSRKHSYTTTPVAPSPAKPNETHTTSADLKTNEIILILNALRKCNYNQTSAAYLLGISRDALIRKMKKFHITISKIELQA